MSEVRRCWHLGAASAGHRRTSNLGGGGGTSGAALPNLGGGALQRLRRRCHGRQLLLLFSIAAGAAGWDCHCCYGWQRSRGAAGKGEGPSL